ncbi:lantibiotic dehydratase family protein [Streptomyces sp. NPDC001536]|uniref:lantibiotic dehydratase family protein n=1 Tax=Streptomyces sp. NPDC001536 TaxID=3364583 RepID=UPI0036AA23C0
MPHPGHFTVVGPALVRLPLAPADRAVGGVAPASAAPTAEQLRARIAELLRDDVLREAVALASPSTALVCRQSLDRLPEKRLRSLAASLTAYAARMRGRATPFGLFAGVTVAPFTDTARGQMAPPHRHRRAVRPDAAWLRTVVQALARSPRSLTALTYTASPAVRRDGATHVLPAPDARVSRVALRTTPPLDAVLDAAARPARGDSLQAAARAHGLSPRDAGRLLATLVTHGFLVCELQPPAHSDDPLGHVLDRLRRAALHPEPTRLIEEYEAALTAYADTPPGEAEDALARVHDLADRVARSAGADPGTGSPLHVDTLVEADIAFGPEVRAEAERAAAVLARFATARERGHIQRHLRHVSGGYAVPLAEFHCPPLPTRSPSTHPALLAAYADALREGRPEIVLDDALLDAVAPAAGTAPVTELDLFAVVAAPGLAALRRGDFELHVRRPASTSAGTALARFAPALGPAGEQALRTVHDRTDQVAAGRAGGPVVLADITYRPRQAPAENVARATLTRPARIHTNSPADGSRTGDLHLQDLLLFPGADGPQVWSRALGTRVLPRAATALNAETTGPHSAHLLAAAAGENLALGFDWGALATAPWLPRVRRGRTVLSPQTWRLEPALTHGPSWHERFAQWCRRWNVPSHVTLVDGDRQLSLHLDDPVDLHLLHRQTQKSPTTLTEPLSHDHAWAHSPHGTHLVEAVFPLTTTDTPAPPTTTPAAGPSVTPSDRRRHGAPPERPRPLPPVLPGGAWLRAVVGCPGGRWAVLRGRLSEVFGGRRWFFTHVDHEHAELCVRLAQEDTWGSLLARLSGTLADDPAVEGPTILPYPRDAGFGTPVAQPDLAERWAAVDTRCALAALGAGEPYVPLLGVLDLAARLSTEGGASPLADITPDRRGFSPQRRAVLPLLTDPARRDNELPSELTELWEERATRTRACLQQASSPQAAVHEGRLMLRQHALRLAGTAGADGLLGLAAAAEHALHSWHRATRSAA